MSSGIGGFGVRVRLARGVWRPAKHIPACFVFECGRSEGESMGRNRRRLRPSDDAIVEVWKKTNEISCQIGMSMGTTRTKSLNLALVLFVGL